ncbi:MAG: GlxA family transcriptional regulator, partial [Pseudomonadota bacterium]
MEKSAQPSARSQTAEPEEIFFLLIEGFTHLALSASVEVLRVANMLSGRELYRWALMADGGASQLSSNGLETRVHSDLINLRAGKELYIVSGLNVEARGSRALTNYLRVQKRHGVEIGALCSAAYILAEAGVLAGKTCAVHWEYHPLFRERFPDVELTQEAFFARARPYTASGGTAGAELMLELISRAHGTSFARQVADQLVLPAVRAEGDVQRMPNHIRYGTRNRILLQTLDYMSAHIEDPMTTPEIASFVGVSVRQIERVFRKCLGCSPGQHYKRMRLEHAKSLLATTDLSVIQIALASGFGSASHFSRAYRSEFGETPHSQFR